MAPTRLVRSSNDVPLVTELPAGTKEEDYPKWYCVMGYAEFLALLPSAD